MESYLEKLWQDTKKFFQLAQRQHDQARQAELTVLHNSIFHKLLERLNQLNWTNQETVNRTLRPYHNGLTQERADYITIMKNTRTKAPANLWQEFVKQVQTELCRLRVQMTTETGHRNEELTAGQEIAGQTANQDGLEAVLEDLGTWPIDNVFGDAARSRLLRALRALKAEENVRALGALRLTVLEVVAGQETIARLRGDLQAAEIMLEEAAAQPAPKPPAPVSQEETEVEDDDSNILADIIKERIGDIETALELLEEELAEAEQRSMYLAAWISRAEEQFASETARRRLLTSRNERWKIDTWTSLVRGRIEAIRTQQTEVERVIAPLARFKQRLSSELGALRTVLECLDSEVGLHKSSSLPVWEEPNLESLFSEDTDTPVNEPIPLPTETSKVPVEQVEDLPFDTNFDKDAAQSVREFEAFLASFQGQSQAEIKRRLPLTPTEKQERYYDLLIENLRQGSFLSALKMAITVLNAARRNGQPVPRLSKTVMTLMKSRGVRISTFTGSEATDAGRALGLVFILGLIDPRWQIVNRMRTGSRWGLGNELTDLGRIFANIWTQDLLASGQISREQIAAIVQTIKEWDERENKKKPT